MNMEREISTEIIGKCCECGTGCTERDLIGNGMIQDGLGEWPRLWCSNCIDRHLNEDFPNGLGK